MSAFHKLVALGAAALASSCSLLFEESASFQSSADGSVRKNPPRFLDSSFSPKTDSSKDVVVFDATTSAFDAGISDAQTQDAPLPPYCNVWEQSGCGGGDDCYYNNAGENGICALSTGDLGYWDTCSNQTECAAGSICRNSHCIEVCRSSEPYPQCDPSFSCVQTADIQLCFPDV